MARQTARHRPLDAAHSSSDLFGGGARWVSPHVGADLREVVKHHEQRHAAERCVALIRFFGVQERPEERAGAGIGETKRVE
jgi:hypothetical protein